MTCTFKDSPKHLSELGQREWCNCSRCRKIAEALADEHNKRAARIRYNEGKYIPEWRLLGK